MMECLGEDTRWQIEKTRDEYRFQRHLEICIMLALTMFVIYVLK